MLKQNAAGSSESDLPFSCGNAGATAKQVCVNLDTNLSEAEKEQIHKSIPDIFLCIHLI